MILLQYTVRWYPPSCQDKKGALSVTVIIIGNEIPDYESKLG